VGFSDDLEPTTRVVVVDIFGMTLIGAENTATICPTDVLNMECPEGNLLIFEFWFR
jgi:hypothetical protein